MRRARRRRRCWRRADRRSAPERRSAPGRRPSRGRSSLRCRPRPASRRHQAQLLHPRVQPFGGAQLAQGPHLADVVADPGAEQGQSDVAVQRDLDPREVVLGAFARVEKSDGRHVHPLSSPGPVVRGRGGPFADGATGSRSPLALLTLSSLPSVPDIRRPTHPDRGGARRHPAGPVRRLGGGPDVRRGTDVGIGTAGRRPPGSRRIPAACGPHGTAVTWPLPSPIMPLAYAVRLRPRPERPVTAKKWSTPLPWALLAHYRGRTACGRTLGREHRDIAAGTHSTVLRGAARLPRARNDLPPRRRRDRDPDRAGDRAALPPA